MVVGRYVVHAASRTGRPLVATNHFMPENLAAHAPIPRPLQRIGYRIAWRDLGRIFGMADAVTAPTPRAVELLVRSAGLKDAFPVSCGIDAERYHASTPDTAAEPTVLFVGRMDQEKRVDELIRAFAALPPGVPARLELIGDGPEREAWTALVAALGVGHRVRFRGFVSEEDLVEAYARADVFCMPGIAELQSLVTLEAMASGTPVVAADAMALPHLVRPGRNGWLYTPGDVPELTTRLTALLSDPAQRRRMAAAGLDIVAEHAIDATLDTFEDLYRGLAARNRVHIGRAA
jgi:glycosyltransferase involved in cell wall biosynthesis